MSNNSEKEPKCVYAVPSQQEELVTTICRIVGEEPPQPMRAFKKSTKVSTAADQFSADHHGEYEARARQSCGKIERVHRHNEACPKMYDELKKKGSAARVVAVTMSRKDALHLTCSRKTNTYTRQRRYKKSKEKQRTIRNKLTKRRQTNRQKPTSNRTYRLSKIWKSKGCQCHPPGKSDESAKIEDVIVWTRQSRKQPSQTSQRSYRSDKFAGTSATSVSTYHTSFSSMAQEPMVS